MVVDHKGARIVADGINYPNEARLDSTGRWLYTNETTAGRLLRYPVGADAVLGRPEVVWEFDESNMLDGFALDSEGGIWMTALVSNRLWYLSPSGDLRLLLEEYDRGHLEQLVQEQKTAGVTRALLYQDHGNRLANISSIAFGGPDLKTVYLGSLMGTRLHSFRSPIAGARPAHWNYGPFG